MLIPQIRQLAPTQELGSMHWTLITFHLILYTVYVSGVFYCPEDGNSIVINNTSGVIHTLFEGDVHYRNDMDCEWVIDAGNNSNARIMITIDEDDLDLQWTPENAICTGYDHIQVDQLLDEDSEHTEAENMALFCGERNPRSLTSTGPKVRVKFWTNDRNTYDYTGAKIQFEVFETSTAPGDCPPGWYEDTSVDTNYCYTVKQHEETWGTAQDFCNNNQANLVSLIDDREADFITELVRSSDVEEDDDEYWIGLNDLTVNAQYAWIDKIQDSLEYRWRTLPHEPNKYWKCIAMQPGDGKWSEHFCTESDVKTLVKYKFVCKTKKVGQTELHQVPDETPDKDKGKKGLDFPVKIILIVLGVAAGLAIIIGVLVFHNKHKARHGSPRRSPNNDRRNPSVRYETPSAPPTSAPPSYAEANRVPTYDESVRATTGGSRDVNVNVNVSVNVNGNT